MLFIDASKECVKATNSNKLSTQNIENILEIFTERKDEIAYVSRLVLNADIAANDYNLSVSSYVEAEDTREKIDIKKVKKDICSSVSNEDKLRTKITESNSFVDSGSLEKMINKLCPQGVEYKTLGELGQFYGGITGKSKSDFIDGNAKFITYMNVYKNLKIKLDVPEKVKIGENEKQRTLEYGDVLFTGSSETPDECGISSVLADKTDEKLYLNSFCFFYRFTDKKLFNPEFSKYLFRSQELRTQIGKTASGVTRFNVSKEKMKKVKIPVPPLEIQNEIVRILDNYTELEKELEARRKEYTFYLEKVLTF